MLLAAERPLIVAGGGVINADASRRCWSSSPRLTGIPVVPTLMGWGAIPDDHPLKAGMVGLQTSHRYGNATFLDSDFVLGIGNRWAEPPHRLGRGLHKGRKFVHVDIEPTQIGRVFGPDLGIVSDAKAALELFVEVAREMTAAGSCRTAAPGSRRCQQRKRTMLAPDRLRRRCRSSRSACSEEINEAFGRDTCFVTSIGLSPDRRGASSCTSTGRATRSTAARRARSAGHPGGARRASSPTRDRRSWRCRATTISSS